MYPFSLKNHGVDHEVNEMFDMGAETMAIPTDEKMKFEQGNDGMSFGYALRYVFLATSNQCDNRYKAAGANATDEYGTLDTVEFINVAKDDALAWPKIARRTYPQPIAARMESTIAPFVRKSLAVNATLLEVFNDRLGLPEGELAKRHAMEEFSGSEARCIRNPPRPQGMSEEQRAIGAHTDFGSLVGGVGISKISTEYLCSRFSTIDSEDYKSWFLGRKNGSISRYAVNCRCKRRG
jgi:isopenicillin N synthase-like dioxygenase